MTRAPTRTLRKLISCFFDLQLISELFICEILCRPVYAHADEPRLNKFPVFEYFLYSLRAGLLVSSLQPVPN